MLTRSRPLLHWSRIVGEPAGGTVVTRLSSRGLTWITFHELVVYRYSSVPEALAAEGSEWVRGMCRDDSPEVAALRVAQAL